MIRRITALALAAIAALAAPARPALAQSNTAFTYQAELREDGQPANGAHDFTFSLWDALADGNQIGSTIMLDDVPVDDGLVTVELDFGANAFDNSGRWLQIDVNTVPLAPRQPITRAPYAIQTRGIFVDEDGSVGIGTTDPRFALTVRGTGANSDSIQFQTSAGVNNWHLSQTAGGLDFVETGVAANRLYLQREPFGGVGIGTRPTRDLTVRGALGIENDSGLEKFRLFSDNAGLGSPSWAMLNSSGNFFILATSIQGSPDSGALAVGDNADPFKAMMFVGGDGLGRVQADIKNFREPNPVDPATDIVYACIEGPEAAMYVRGSATLVDGRAHVNLPDHFSNLAVLEGMTVTLTPGSFGSKGLAWANKSLTGFDVGELHGGEGNYEFDWEVKAVRKGYEDYRVVRPWDEVLPGGIEREEAWQKRLARIAARPDAVRPTAADEPSRAREEVGSTRRSQ